MSSSSPSSSSSSSPSSPTPSLSSSTIAPAALDLVVSSHVKTVFGVGIIKDIRASDNVYIVELLHWKLADSKSPVLYMQKESLQYHSIKSKFALILDDVNELKRNAGQAFATSEYNIAKSIYEDALIRIKNHGNIESLTNNEKALLFEFVIPVHNNVALCIMNSQNTYQDYCDSYNYSKSAYELIVTLEGKGPESQVYQCIISRGPENLIRYHKKKCLFLMGKSAIHKGEYDLAINHLKESIALIGEPGDDKLKQNELKTLKTMIVKAKEAMQKEIAKEKATWSKAFKENSSQGTPATPATAATASSGGGDADKKKKSSKDVSKDTNKGVDNNDEGTVTKYFTPNLLWWVSIGLGVGLAVLGIRRSKAFGRW